MELEAYYEYVKQNSLLKYIVAVVWQLFFGKSKPCLKCKKKKSYSCTVIRLILLCVSMLLDRGESLKLQIVNLQKVYFPKKNEQSSPWTKSHAIRMFYSSALNSKSVFSGTVPLMMGDTCECFIQGLYTGSKVVYIPWLLQLHFLMSHAQHKAV